MSKTFKTCVIFFISSLWLVIMRIIFSVLPLSDNISSWLFSLFVQVVGMGIIPLLLYKYWVKEDVITGFSIKVKLPVPVYLYAVLLGLLLYYLTIGISLIWQNVLALLGFTHINAVGTIYSGVEVLILELFTTALLPAIFEELTDRGLAVQMFKGIEDEKVTIFLIALLFALGHQNIMQTGYAFVGGLLFGFLALKTKSIIPGMIIHFINNAISVIGGYSAQRGGMVSKLSDALYGFINNHFLLALLTWAAAVAAIIWIAKRINFIMKNTKVEKENNLSENTPYYFPNKVQYVDELFGSSLTKDLTIRSTSRWYEYAFLYGSLIITVLTTIFSFMWGVWR